MESYLSTRLHYQHKSLLDMIDGLSEESIRRELVPGKWSIFENIVHLQTYQHVFCWRMKKIIEEDNPGFLSYRAEEDPAFRENCSKTFREIMGDLITTRKEMASGHLTIQDEVFERKGTHPLYGVMTIGQWLNFFLLHEAHHLYTVFKMAAQIKKK